MRCSMVRDMYTLPVSSNPNQEFRAKIIIDDNVLELTIHLNFREVCRYWTIDLLDINEQYLLSNVPLIKNGTVGNILHQFNYLGLGYLIVLDAASTGEDYPGAMQLGTEFILVWGSQL